uniref:Transposase n=1 Tax=Heterorhabditis bacteriophora TaxID=37862 RepID=A0A1I7WZZ6_HETBA
MHLVSHQRLIDLTYISGVYKYQFTLIKAPNPSKRAFYHTDSQHRSNSTSIRRSLILHGKQVAGIEP